MLTLGTAVPALAVPLTGIKNIPVDYPTLEAAIADLNLNGVGVGGVTFEMNAGYAETFTTATAGQITATGTSANPIVFQKIGAGDNPFIMATTGTQAATTAALGADAVITLVASDWVTFDGIDLYGNQSAINVTEHTEYGLLLARTGSGATLNGCNNNTFKNGSVIMLKGSAFVNTTTGTPVGIFSSAGTFAAPQTPITPIAGALAAGRSSNNKFQSSTIGGITVPGPTNVGGANIGIWLQGINDVTPFANYDQGNVVGGTGTGNTIQSIGGYATAAYGIRASYQNLLNASNNTINNTAAGGTSAINLFYGVWLETATNASSTVNSNNITLLTTGHNFATAGVFSDLAGTGTLTASSNTIGITSNVSAASSGTRTGVFNNAAVTNFTANSNGVTFNVTATAAFAVTGTTSAVRNFANITGNLNALNNTGSFTLTSTAAAATLSNNYYQVLSGGGVAGNANISGNSSTFTTNVSNGTVSGTLAGVSQQATAVGGTLTISSNTYTFNLNNSVAGVISAVAAYGVYDLGATVTGAAQFNSNTVNLNATNSAASANNSAPMGGIQSSGVFSSTVSYDNNNVNIVQSNTGTGTSTMSGALSGVVHAAGAISGAATMSGNAITLSSTRSAAQTMTSAFTGVSNVPATSSSLTMSGNQMITAGSSIATGTYTFLSPTGNNAGGMTVSNNEWKNQTTASTGTIRAFGVTTNTANVLFSNNQVDNASLTGASGTTQLFNNSGNPGVGTQTISGNTFQNITLAAASTMSFTGISTNTTVAQTTIVTNNVLRNVTGASTGTVLGLNITIAGTGAQVSLNTVNNLSTAGTTTGMVFSPTTGAIFRNKIGDLATSGLTATVTGLSITGGTSPAAYNNIIGDLRATGTTGGFNQIVGIAVTGGTTAQLYYNSVYLNQTASLGTDFGSSALFVSSTSVTLDLRNNIFHNSSARNGASTGRTVAFRSTSTLAQLATQLLTSTNRNLYYAGAPTANNLIYVSGTATLVNPQQTLANYQAFVKFPYNSAGVLGRAPIDAYSLTADVTSQLLNSTTVTGSDYLHFDPTVATVVANAGSPIQLPVAGILGTASLDVLVDYDNGTRLSVTTDIGADEFNGVMTDQSPPVIVYTPLTNTGSTGARTLSTLIADGASGNLTTGTDGPIIYFRKGPINGAGVVITPATVGNGWSTAAGVGTGGAGYDFTINIPGLVAGDSVYYYIGARDNTNFVATDAVGGTGTSTPGINAPAKLSLRGYKVLAGFTGNYYVGTAGGHTVQAYPTIAAAVTAINGGIITGPVRLVLTDPAYAENTNPTIAANIGSSSTNTISIVPDGAPLTAGPAATPVITSSSTTAALTIGNATNGASWVTIDGNNGVTTRAISIVNTATAAGIVVRSAGTGLGSTNIVIKNLNITGNAITAGYGVSVGGSTGGSTGADNDNVRLENLNILKVNVGIYASGTATTATGGLDGLVITGNTVGPLTSGANNIGATGMQLANLAGTVTPAQVTNNTVQFVGNAAVTTNGMLVTSSVNPQITGNTVRNLTLSTGATNGMSLSTLNGALVARNVVQNVSTTSTTGPTGVTLGTSFINSVFDRNTIDNITNANAGGWPARGLLVSTVTTNANTEIRNNMISRVYAYGDDFVLNLLAYSPVGIYVTASQSGIRIYNNSVSLNGTTTPLAAGTAIGTAALGVLSGATGLDVRNNIFADSILYTGNTAFKAYAFVSSAPRSAYTAISNNVYWATGPRGVLASFFNGTTQADVTTLAALQNPATGTGLDGGSRLAYPSFTSGSDLHISTPGGKTSSAESGGVALGSVTVDLDGDLRFGQGGYPGTSPNANGQVLGGGTAVDIGADEGNFTPLALMAVSPPITYTRATGATGFGATNQLVTSITVNTTGSITPLTLGSISFDISASGATATPISDITNAQLYSSNSPVFSVGTATLIPTTGTIGATFTLTPTGTVTVTSNPIYFFLTVDVTGSPAPGATIAAIPTTVQLGGAFTPTLSGSGTNVLTIFTPLAGTYSVGVGSLMGQAGHYATLTAAVNDLNVRGVSALVTFSLTSSGSGQKYSVANGETFPIKLTEFVGASTSNRVIIKPAATMQPRMEGNADPAVFWIYGADFVTIDGSNTVGGITRDFQITQLNTTGKGDVMIQSLGTGLGCNNVIIKNLNLIAGNLNAGGALSVGGGVDPMTGNFVTGADNDNVTIQNNTISTSYFGIYAGGATAVSAGGTDNLIITGNVLSNMGGSGMFLVNLVNPSVTNNIVQNITQTLAGVDGIVFNVNVNGATVTGNTIQNITGTAGTLAVPYISGIYLGQNFINGTVSRNKIDNVTATSTGGEGGRGIMVQTANATANVEISNNMISRINGSGYTNFQNSSTAGIYLTGTQAGFRIYYNSVSMNGAQPSYSTTAAILSGALVVETGSTNLDVRNNIFSNTMTWTGNSAAKSYAFYSSAPNTAYTTIDYNDYWVTGANGVLAYFGANVATLGPGAGSLIAATGQDAGSINIDPAFTTTSDLHVLSAPGLKAGIVIPGATTGIDFDGQPRATGSVMSPPAPFIGADEDVPVTVDVKPTALLLPGTTGCFGSAETVQVEIKNNSTLAVLTAAVTVTAVVTLPDATTATLTGTLAAGSNLAIGGLAPVTLTPTLDMSLGGSYAFDITTTTAGDGLPSNDNIVLSRFITAPEALPYTQDFNSGTSLFAINWTATNFAINTTRGNGTGNALSTSSATGTATAPIAGLTTTTASIVSFDARFAGAGPGFAAATLVGTDRLEVQLSTNCGTSFSTIYTINNSNYNGTGTPSTDFYRYRAVLTGVGAGQQVQVRFLLTKTGTAYFADIDNVNIRSLPPIDIVPLALLTPATTGCYGAAESISVQVQNLGTATVNLATDPVNISVAVSPGGTFTGTLNVGTLAPLGGVGSTATVTATSGTLNMTTPATYTFIVTATTPADGYTTNDILSPNPTRVKVAPTVGVASASPANICGSSGTPVLSVASYAGGTITWESSTTGGVGTFLPLGGSSGMNPFTAPSISTTMYYRAIVTCGGTAASNTVQVNVINPQVTASAGDSRCGTGTVMLTATGSAGTTLNWYDTNVSTAVLATGSPFTPTVTATRNYYVGAVATGGSTSVGPLTNAAVGATGGGFNGFYVTFNVNQATVLTGVYVFPTAAGTLIVDYLTSGGTLIQSASTTLVAGDVGVKTFVPLAFNLAAGTAQRLMIRTAGTTATLYRNSAGAVYPYVSADGNVSITGNSFDPTYFYHFYDWQLESGCVSARTAVPVTVNPALALGVTGGATRTICAGDNVVVSFTNYPNLSVTPNTGTFISGATITFNPSETTSYVVTGDDGTGPAGCSNTATVNINVNPVPGAPALTPSSSQNICSGSSVVVAALSGVVSSNILSADFNAGADGFTVASTGTPTTTGFQLKTPGYDLGADGYIFNGSGNTQGFVSDVDVAGSGSSVNTTLTSPAFSTVGYASASLTFDHFYRNLGATSDSAIVEINKNGGAWTRLVKYTSTQGTLPATTPNPITLNGVTLAVPAGFVGQANVRIRFRYRGGWVWWWAIDNVFVTGTPNPVVYTVTPALGASVAGSNITFNPTTTTTYTVNAAYSGTPLCTAGTPITINVSAPNFTYTKADATCNGGTTGSITVTASGGLGTYEYSKNGVAGPWQTSNVFSSLTAGSYQIAVRDVVSMTLTCTSAEQTVIIGQPAAVTFTATPSVSCSGGAGGTITFASEAGGGGGPYTYSTDNGMTFSSVNPITGLAAATYNVVVKSAAGCVSAPVPVTLVSTSTLVWKGGTVGNETNWYTPTNWTPNCVPSAIISVQISNRPYMPVIAAGGALANNVTLTSTGKLTLSGGTLTLSGNFTNSGLFVQTGGTVVLSGLAVRNIGQVSTTTFKDLTIAGSGATLTGPVRITGVLTLSAPLTPAGFLTLMSSATGTGMIVNTSPTTNYATGPVTVQRYVAGLDVDRGYRWLASPVAGAPFTDMAVAGSANGFVPKVNPAYNLNPNILAAAQYPNILGFDENRAVPVPLPAPPAPYLPNDFQDGYYSPAALSGVTGTMRPGQGWSVYFPDHKAFDLTGVPGNGAIAAVSDELGSTVLTRTGATARSGNQLIGNPYPAPIDWDVTATPGAGGTVTLPAGMDNTATVFQSAGGVDGVFLTQANAMGSIPNGEIALGQAFLVHTNADLTFSFTNVFRKTSYSSPVLHRGTTTDPRPAVSLKLHQTGTPLYKNDQAFVYFQAGATVNVDALYDGRKPSHNLGTVPTLVSLTGTGQELAINGLPETSLQAGTVVNLLVDARAAGAYTLTAENFANLPTTPNAVVLVDRQLGVRTSLAAGVVYPFTVAAMGINPGRFALEFGATTAPTGVSASVDGTSLSVYPNPASARGAVQVVGAAAGERVSLLDATGRVVRVATMATTGVRLDVADLSAGVYTVRAGGQTRRLVIE